MVETANKRKWFRRKGSKREDKNNNAAEVASQASSFKTEASSRRGGGLFSRNRKKKIVVTRPKKNAGAVIIPSRSFEGTEETSGSPRREFKLAEELREIKLSKVGNSLDTHQDSVSSAQEESINGDGFDLQHHHHQNPVQHPPLVENDDNQDVPNEANLDDAPQDEANQLSYLKADEKMIPEISCEIASQAQTAKAYGSPVRKVHDADQEAQVDQQNASLSAPSRESMPNEVVTGGIPACGTHEEITVFSENSDDRELGISTPPALKRNRSRAATDVDSSSKGTRSTNDLEARSFDVTNKPGTRSDRVLRQMELETLKKQLEDEKLRIKQQLEQEDARLSQQERERSSSSAEVPAEKSTPNDEETTIDENAFSVIDWDAQADAKPIAMTPPRKQSDPFGFAARNEGSEAIDNFGFADFKENFGQKEMKTPPSVIGSAVPSSASGFAPSSTFATESFFRFAKADAKKSDAGKSSSALEPETLDPLTDETMKAEALLSVPKTHIAPDPPEQSIFQPLEEPVVGSESAHRVPLVKRTTSDGSMGLETKSALKRISSKESTGLVDPTTLNDKARPSQDPPTEEPIEMSRSTSSSPTEEPIEVSRSKSTEELMKHQEPVKLSKPMKLPKPATAQEPVKLKASQEAKQQKKKRRQRRRQRARIPMSNNDPNDADTEKDASAEKDYKVRLVENESSSRFGGVEVEHLPGDALPQDEFPEDATESQSQCSRGSRASRSSRRSRGSRSWFGSRLSGNSGSDTDSHYDSDPDPFSGIEEARLAALTLALKNAREAVAKKAGDTDALINDTTFSKRPTRVLFQRKTFFKRLKQGREKKGATGKAGQGSKASNTKVTRKGKLAPLENQNTSRVASAQFSSSKAVKPPPPPPPPALTPKEASVVPTRNLHKESNADDQLIPGSFNSRAAAVSDIEVNMDRASPNNILRNVSVVEEERETIVSEEEEESDASSWDEEVSQDESTDDEFSRDGYGVQVLMSVARSFSRTITWGTGLAVSSHPTISQRSTMSDGFLSDNPLSDGDGTYDTLDEDNLVLNQSFSFSAGRNEDESSTSSDEDTIRSEDILALKSRFACM